MNRPERLFAGVLVVALAGAGVAYYWAQTRQAATLGHITALENRLISSNEQRAKDAKNTVSRMGVTVRKNYNPAVDMAVLQHSKDIQSHTQVLVDTLHQLRQYWQVDGHRTELRQLPAQLEQYVAFIRSFVPDAPLLNYNSPQIELFSWLGKCDTAREPKPVALALLTKLETQVRQVEREALMYQTQKVGISGDSFEKTGASAIPESEIVAPGSLYQAQLLLALASSARRTHASANGRAIPINPATDKALVQFKVPTTRPGQPDTVRAVWHGRMQMPWADGDTVLNTTVPYFIVKPVQR